MAGAQKSPNSVSWARVKPAPIVLISTKEPLFADRAWFRLKAMLQREYPELEVTDFEASSYQAGYLQTVTSPSLFNEPRLVKVSGAGTGSEKFYLDLADYLKDPTEQTWLVLDITSGLRGKKVFAEIRKLGYPDVDDKELNQPWQKVKMVQEDMRRAKRPISEEAAGALVDACGSDLRELAAAIKQLLADTEGEITPQIVKRYYSGKVESTAFNVADAVAAGQMGHALALLRSALACGTEPVLIVAAIATKLRQIARAQHYGTSPKAARDIGISPAALRYVEKNIPLWDDRSLAGAIAATAKADAAVKGASRDPIHAVEKLIIYACRVRAGRI
ncbi:DNA polymerase III subunit delta [Boudabousia tangfeifanii]|uniref:DNA-directed DNA polymerase n=1 Tax=Boudabousia tangfeifanii TaxID=1912795 RepID=A0A1D9ML12_9ACTO|nr:DNA polymerase III subunit delta [Boudabousia tangfeifanii]AOZ72928.1 DNA polymerase III subunit delta [Boudabousia tangfeifanii]